VAKKHGRRARKRNFPWVLLALGGVLLLVAAFLYFANRGGGDTGGTPAIAVDPASIDYGYQKLGTNLTFEIKVANAGTGTLRFKEKPYIEVLEGC
jgi:hypothetical protein